MPMPRKLEGKKKAVLKALNKTKNGDGSWNIEAASRDLDCYAGTLRKQLKAWNIDVIVGDNKTRRTDGKGGSHETDIPKREVEMALEDSRDHLGRWSKTRASEALGIHTRTLNKHITKYKIKPPEYDPGLAGALRDARDNERRNEEMHKLKAENKGFARQIRDLTEAKLQADSLADIIQTLGARRPTVPKWLAPRIKGTQERAIVTAILSDCHYDEVVRPEQIDWVNGYDREIAVQRTMNFFEHFITLSRDYINGILVEGAVVPLLGDLVSGNIHEELKETNETGIIETVLFWSEILAAGFEMLLEHFPKIYVPCVVGNHGRLSRKPVMKYRAQESFDFLIYHMLARHFRIKGATEIEFAISEGADFKYQIYNTRYQLSHGDQFRGGTGIAGLFSPLMLGHHRKSRKEAAKKTPYDHLLMGHWHQLRDMYYIIVNGSLKGYDEFAEILNFDIEPPQQAFWLTDPTWGKTIFAPIHVLGDDEYWRGNANVEAKPF